MFYFISHDKNKANNDAFHKLSLTHLAYIYCNNMNIYNRLIGSRPPAIIIIDIVSVSDNVYILSGAYLGVHVCSYFQASTSISLKREREIERERERERGEVNPFCIQTSSDGWRDFFACLCLQGLLV